MATNDLHYVHADDAEAHDTLLCVSSGSNRDTPNRFKFDGSGYYLKSPAEMRRIWAELPEACDNTLAIAERCETHFDEGTGTYMAQFPVPAGETEESWFAKEVRHGLKGAFPEGVPSYATEQAEFETKVITDKEKYCFPPGTQVLLGDGTWRPIESIRVGDEITSVSTWNLKGRPAVVEDVISRVVDEEICVIHPFGQTNEVRATAEHPFLVDSKGWVPASQVQPGDWLAACLRRSLPPMRRLILKPQPLPGAGHCLMAKTSRSRGCARVTCARPARRAGACPAWLSGQPTSCGSSVCGWPRVT